MFFYMFWCVSQDVCVEISALAKENFLSGQLNSLPHQSAKVIE
jgi:hypothetical protein